MNEIKLKTLDGWIIETLNCSCCDGKLVGKGIDLNNHYLAFEQNEKQKFGNHHQQHAMILKN